MAGAFPVSHFLGRSLLVLCRLSAVFLSVVLLSFPLQRDPVREISSALYGEGSPAMGSRLLEQLMSPWLSVVLVGLMIAWCVFRWRVRSSWLARVADVGYLFVVVLLLSALYSLVYLPVLTAPVLA